MHCPHAVNGAVVRLEVGGKLAVLQAFYKVHFPHRAGAIQQGAVQGQENPIDTIYANKFYEVAPNVTLTHHVYSPIPLTISEKTWQKLSPADQKAVTEAAQISANLSFSARKP